jgi:hypothetical protein
LPRHQVLSQLFQPAGQYQWQLRQQLLYLELV